VDQGEELNTPQHLVLAQFDKVKMHSSIFVWLVVFIITGWFSWLNIPVMLVFW
jgi:hypothetical protein